MPLPHLQLNGLDGLDAAYRETFLLIVCGLVAAILLVCCLCHWIRRGCCGLCATRPPGQQPTDLYSHSLIDQGLDPDELALQRTLESGDLELSGIDASTTAATNTIHRNGMGGHGAPSSDAAPAGPHHSGHRTLGGKIKHAIQSRLAKLQRRARAQMYAPIGIRNASSSLGGAPAGGGMAASGAASPAIQSHLGSPRLDFDDHQYPHAIDIDTKRILAEHEFFTDDDDDDGGEEEDDLDQFETTSLSPIDGRRMASSRTSSSSVAGARTAAGGGAHDATAATIAGRTGAELMAAWRGEPATGTMHLPGGATDLNSSAHAAHDLEQLEMLSATSSPPAAYTA